MSKLIMGSFSREDSLRSAYNYLNKEGYELEDLSTMGNKEFYLNESKDLAENIANGLINGVSIGLFLGTIAGLILGLLRPSVGSFLIGTPVALVFGLQGVSASTLSGSLTGLLVGAVGGALAGLGLTKEEIDEYKNINYDDMILLATVSPEQEDSVKNIMKDFGAEDFKVINLQTKDLENVDYELNPSQLSIKKINLSQVGVKGGRSESEGSEAETQEALTKPTKKVIEMTME